MQVRSRKIYLFIWLLLSAGCFMPIAQANSQTWRPSQDQVAVAMDLMDRYLTKMGAADAREAYGLMTEGFRDMVPFATFAQDQLSTTSLTGDLIGRKILHIEWSKDPSGGPKPGVYVSVDLTLVFQRTHLYCG